MQTSPLHLLHIPWPPPKHFLLTPQIVTPIKQLKTAKPLILSNSLAASYKFEDEELSIEENPINPTQDEELSIEENPINPTRLPVIVRQSDSNFQYSWDGNNLKLVSLDKRSSLSSDFEDGYKRFFRMCSSAARNFFLPREISGNYLEYVKWKFLHRVFSSALQVLATQAMFRAIGVGYSRSLPSAAALNWVLKDGLGRLSRCIYTASLASAFDSNLKRVRFSTSVIFSLSVGLELLTPAFPQYFLLLASVANIAKQISLACYLATSSAVHRSFAIADNLGEVSAKAQIQSVSFDNLGLMLAAALNMLLKNSPRLQAGLAFVIYLIFTAIDLFGIYQALKHVHLNTLTKDRLEIILNMWIELGYVPSPAEVSKAEGIDFFSSKGREPWRIRIGCLNPNSQIPKLSMMTMQSLNDEDCYFICMEISRQGLTRTCHHGILLCLREGAGTADVVLGLLEACYIRKRLLLSATKWENKLEACKISDTTHREWFKLREEGKQSALADISLLIGKMQGLGWACKNILLSTKERAHYSYVPD